MTLHIPPNVPITVCLKDARMDAGEKFDFEVGAGRYETTDGDMLELPRQAAILMNALDPEPGEPVTVIKCWSGRSSDPVTWSISRAIPAGQEPPEPTPPPDPLPPAARAPINAPTPIRTSRKETQPGLFDRGTGTYGPAPRPQFGRPVQVRRMPPEQIPANVAVREVLQFVNADPGTQNWGSEAKQDLTSTILIGFYKAGHIGLWERGE